MALALTLAVGAGAAPSPVDPISEVLGLGGDRGEAVSNAAHDAKANAQEGDNIGAAVSTAVCEALKNSDDLPEPARDASGHANQEEKDCTHPTDMDEEEATEEDSSQAETGAEPQSSHEGDNHGAAVSEAAHKAIEQAKLDGVKVGPVVSEAVCKVNQEKDLPESAQGAQGHTKDCVHPSNAVPDSTVAATESGHGKDFAPGQLKKQGN